MIKIIFIFEITIRREHEGEKYMKCFPAVKCWNKAEGGRELKGILYTQ